MPAWSLFRRNLIGFTKKSEEITKGTADFGGGPLWHIVCNQKITTPLE